MSYTIETTGTTTLIHIYAGDNRVDTRTPETISAPISWELSIRLLRKGRHAHRVYDIARDELIDRGILQD